MKLRTIFLMMALCGFSLDLRAAVAGCGGAEESQKVTVSFMMAFGEKCSWDWDISHLKKEGGGALCQAMVTVAQEQYNKEAGNSAVLDDAIATLIHSIESDENHPLQRGRHCLSEVGHVWRVGGCEEKELFPGVVRLLLYPPAHEKPSNCYFIEGLSSDVWSNHVSSLQKDIEPWEEMMDVVKSHAFCGGEEQKISVEIFQAHDQPPQCMTWDVRKWFIPETCKSVWKSILDQSFAEDGCLDEEGFALSYELECVIRELSYALESGRGLSHQPAERLCIRQLLDDNIWHWRTVVMDVVSHIPCVRMVLPGTSVAVEGKHYLDF